MRCSPRHTAGCVTCGRTTTTMTMCDMRAIGGPDRSPCYKPSSVRAPIARASAGWCGGGSRRRRSGRPWRRVLKALPLVLMEHLQAQLSRCCFHLAGNGRLKGAVLAVDRQTVEQCVARDIYPGFVSKVQREATGPAYSGGNSGSGQGYRWSWAGSP